MLANLCTHHELHHTPMQRNIAWKRRTDAHNFGSVFFVGHVRRVKSNDKNRLLYAWRGECNCDKEERKGVDRFCPFIVVPQILCIFEASLLVSQTKTICIDTVCRVAQWSFVELVATVSPEVHHHLSMGKDYDIRHKHPRYQCSLRWPKITESCGPHHTWYEQQFQNEKSHQMKITICDDSRPTNANIGDGNLVFARAHTQRYVVITWRDRTHSLYFIRYLWRLRNEPWVCRNEYMLMSWVCLLLCHSNLCMKAMFVGTVNVRFYQHKKWWNRPQSARPKMSAPSAASLQDNISLCVCVLYWQLSYDY